ncbi:hypothetical protein D9M73_188680 [compost metagenome]
MAIFFLPVDVPEKWPARPLSAHKGIFATHGIEIAAPQQAVVLVLADEWQHLHGQGVTHMHGTGRQPLHTEPTLDVAENPPFRHQQMSGSRIAGHCIEPTGQPGVFVGKQ